MPSKIPTGFLTLRAGTFQRITRAEREGAHRAINISHCPVTRWSVISGDMRNNKLDGRSFAADEALLISIMEAKPGDLLWTEIAAEAADGAARHIEIVLKPDRSDLLTVTNIGLIEEMPPPSNASGRLHPRCR